MKKSLCLLLSFVLLLALSVPVYAAEPAKKVETNSGVTVMHAADWKEEFPNQYESWMATEEKRMTRLSIISSCTPSFALFTRVMVLPLTTVLPAAISTMSRILKLPAARIRWPTAGPARRLISPTW